MPAGVQVCAGACVGDKGCVFGGVGCRVGPGFGSCWRRCGAAWASPGRRVRGSATTRGWGRPARWGARASDGSSVRPQVGQPEGVHVRRLSRMSRRRTGRATGIRRGRFRPVDDPSRRENVRARVKFGCPAEISARGKRIGSRGVRSRFGSDVSGMRFREKGAFPGNPISRPPRRGICLHPARRPDPYPSRSRDPYVSGGCPPAAAHGQGEVGADTMAGVWAGQPLTRARELCPGRLRAAPPGLPALGAARGRASGPRGAIVPGARDLRGAYRMPRRG